MDPLILHLKKQDMKDLNIFKLSIDLVLENTVSPWSPVKDYGMAAILDLKAWRPHRVLKPNVLPFIQLA